MWNATVPPMQNPTIAVFDGSIEAADRAATAPSTSSSMFAAVSSPISGIAA